MARTKRDNLKRQSAQALNDMAKAIMNINILYEQFLAVHPEHAAYLAQIMVQIAQNREGLISFNIAAWGLDENQIMSYI